MKKDDKFATPAVEDLIKVDELICKKKEESTIEPISKDELGLFIQKRIRIG